LLDTSEPHLLAELSAAGDGLAALLGRPRTLVAECDLYDAVMSPPRTEGRVGLDAQWDDDMHHALHALLTGERQGYYVDFGSLAALSKVYTPDVRHDGSYSAFGGRVHGRPVDRLRTPAYRFVAYLQDHDQVGNRELGDRLPEITPPRLRDRGAVELLTAPVTPMLWMGEE